MSIDGKVAVVTGGSKGIGFAIAESLVKSVAHVFICARDNGELKRAISDLSRSGRVEGEVCDVRSESQVRMMLEECERVCPECLTLESPFHHQMSSRYFLHGLASSVDPKTQK